jgi:tRNA1Val (adenine37-N6)-methyltransferase
MEMSTVEQLNIGNLEFLQPKHGYRFSVDAVLLADFLRIKPTERLIDLGTGSGIIPLLASVLTPAQEIVGIEIQEQLVTLARKNVAMNHLEDRVRILHGDLKHIARHFRSGEFEVLCSNPPYRKIGTGRLNPQDEQAIARHEIHCQIDDLLAACKYLVNPGGKVFLIYLPERLGELISQMHQYHLEPKRLRCVHSYQTTPASLMLIEAHRDAAPGLTIQPPLILYARKNEYTEEAKRILREY